MVAVARAWARGASRGRLAPFPGAWRHSEARGDSPSMRYRLGIALSRNGDANRAREELRTAVDTGTFPEADEARRELAQLER